jgi:threonine dehydratase
MVQRTMEWQVPTLTDVLEARRRISAHLQPTALFGYPSLNELLGADVFVKHENHQPVGSFKVRGGVNRTPPAFSVCARRSASPSKRTR